MKSVRGLKCAMIAIVAVAVSAVLPVASVSSAGELKAAHFMPPMHPMDRGVMTPLSEELAEVTGGELTIRIYPAGELGKGPVQQYKRVVTGVADIVFGIPAYTPTQFDKTVMIHMPGLFASGEQATNALWDNLEAIEDEYAETKLLGLWANNPSVLITRDKPVRTLADIEGLKIRTPNPVMAEVVKAWGGIPVSMPTPDIYNSMNTGVIDAVMIGPSGIRSYKLNEIGKYATVNIPSAVDSFYLLMNKQSWDGLSDEHKAKLSELIGRDLSLRGAKAFYEAGQAGIQLARDSDVEIIEIDGAADADFRAAMADALDALIEKTSKETGTDARKIIAGFSGQ
ncbi:TRAP transporter substrate-binding protein [Hoeflea prorocentri]|uniref:TRAP transporter substrate-binding protein n=1 Tax=Hoeflea prorocentri TaxID=1922333 RepID=A0A9X3UN41_9HYPH|nr:TRAP transporter substrate-binding protein [Hoeflea prorocentri]MCY6383752.1 TRAP transporter substrate-binding protein [Hoeflea prorocentri]MDA5401552.1 TRAP transporter substrate-binding protein [Hoeflea prorocentri]